MRVIAGNLRQPLKRHSRPRGIWRFLLFITLAPFACAASTALPYAARGLLLDAALNGHAIVAVGERGAIVRSVDSGETWEVLASPTRATLTGISFANPTVGWAVGHDGLILTTRDGGETWTEQFHAEDRETVFLDVAAIDSSRAVAVGAFGVCYTTKDGGRNWVRLKLIDEDNHLNRITVGRDAELFIAGERGTLLHLPSFNKSIERLPSPEDVSFYGLTPIAGNTLLAYGLRGHIYRSQDGGQTWERIESPLQALFSTAIRLKSGTILVAGQARAFLVSRDGGYTFRAWEPPITTAVAEIMEAPNGLLLAFGEAGISRLDPPDAPKTAPEVPAVFSP
ncbi:MAG: YCF48-related protein [Nibricoccus sp.]